MSYPTLAGLSHFTLKPFDTTANVLQGEVDASRIAHDWTFCRNNTFSIMQKHKVNQDFMHCTCGVEALIIGEAFSDISTWPTAWLSATFAALR